MSQAFVDICQSVAIVVNSVSLLAIAVMYGRRLP